MLRRERLEAMLAEAPDDLFLRYALALEFRSTGETAAALGRLQEVLDRDPDYVAAYFQRAQLLAEQGESAAAQDELGRGIDVARRVGDQHALGEMTGFLESLSA